MTPNAPERASSFLYFNFMFEKYLHHPSKRWQASIPRILGQLYVHFISTAAGALATQQPKGTMQWRKAPFQTYD